MVFHFDSVAILIIIVGRSVAAALFLRSWISSLISSSVGGSIIVLSSGLGLYRVGLLSSLVLLSSFLSEGALGGFVGWFDGGSFLCVSWLEGCSGSSPIFFNVFV